MPPLAPTSWLRLPRRTARLRLTLLYAGLFLLSGTVILAIIYFLVARATPLGSVSVAVRAHNGVAGSAFHFTQPISGPLVAQHKADVSRLLEVSWIVLAIATVASGLLGWFASGRVLRPLRSITDQARTISAGNLHQRLAVAGPDDEFKRLGDTLDELLARLEASFEAQRRFVANASHELRTPLTVERTLLQVALADPNATAAQLRATCEELLVAGAEHERLLEALLTLASGERGLDRRQPVDLAAVTARVLDVPRPLLERHSIEISSHLEPAIATGEEALLERLVANLIDNAVQNNLASGRIEVRTATVGGSAQLTVSNTGPEVPADQVERLLEPFQRLGTQRTGEDHERHGLGLSIVRAIALAHEAALNVRPRPGGGLVVTVSFTAPMADLSSAGAAGAS